MKSIFYVMTIALFASCGHSGNSQQSGSSNPSPQTEEQRLNCPQPFAGKQWCAHYTKHTDQGPMVFDESMSFGWNCKYSYSVNSNNGTGPVGYGDSGDWNYLDGHIYLHGTALNGKYDTSVSSDGESYYNGSVLYKHCGNAGNF